jgi:ACS family sodium-dependent inorganic phosphate cotransporter
MTMLTPFARSVSTMLVVRVSLGIGEGLSPPSLYSTIARWIPAAERSRAMAFVATGMYVGLIIAFPTAVWIMTRLGWPWVFYLFGLLGLAWWVAWHLLVTDKPEDHPNISEAEIQTILHGQASTPQAEAIPWRRFFREPAFLALICAHFSTNWTYYIFLTWLPTYLVQVRQFSLQEMGLYATFPYVAMMLIGNGAAWVADGMIKAGTSVTRVRKLFQTVAFLGATVFLLILTISESQWLTVVCITLGLGALSCFASGMGVNHLDIGPKYAGALVGITNTAATLPGILAPFLTGLIVQLTGNWNMVFYLAAGVMVVGMLVWNLFATGETLFE